MKPWKLALIGVFVGVSALIAFGYYRLHASEIPPQVMAHFASLDVVEICSTHPFDDMNSVDYGKGNIDGFSIVDFALIEPDQLLRKLSVADRANNTIAANCFWPHHAIRDPNNHDNYLLICFKCLQVRYSANGETGLALIDESAKAIFEAAIDEHGLERSKKH